jgi:hypothetical protein
MGSKAPDYRFDRAPGLVAKSDIWPRYQHWKAESAVKAKAKSGYAAFLDSRETFIKKKKAANSGGLIQF